MKPEQLRFIVDCLRDLRFIQAAALVGSGQHQTKSTREYMNRLGAAIADVEKLLLN